MKKIALPTNLEEAPPPPVDAARLALLERGALTVGDRWEEACRASLARQGRLVSGAWPGTMTEARAQVTAYFLAEHRGTTLTWDERERAARTSYARAKQRWLAR